jgi:hypothetical protein
VGNWPVWGGQQQKIAALVDSAGSGGISITKAAAINTKGPWVELTASAPLDAGGLLIHGNNFRAGCWDLSIGAAGDEANKIIVNDLFNGMGGNSQQSGGTSVMLPLAVKAGSRLSARMQCVQLTYSSGLAVYLLAGAFQSNPPFNRCVTYGFDSSNTKGTDIDPGATINTKGAWTEFVASLTHPVKAILLCTNHTDATNVGYTTYLIDIGVGAAGSEKVVVPDIWAVYDYYWGIKIPYTRLIACNIAAGSRVSLRAQCSINTATKRVLDAVLYCFY